MGHNLGAALITLAIAASLCIPIAKGTWGVYSQPGFDEGRSIAAANDAVYVGALSIGPFDGYRLLKYNATGTMAWEKQFSVPERRITKERYRHIAVAATPTSVSVAFTNGTFNVKAYHPNGTQRWENRWRRPGSVTDLAMAGNHTIVAGCADGVSSPRYHVVAFDDGGNVAWNASGHGCIYGIDVDGGTVLLAGERDGTGILLSMNTTGGITGTRNIAGGAIRDVAATSSGIVLLHSTGGNVSLVTVPSTTEGNATYSYYGKTATGNALLAAQGRVFIAGNVYNQSARYRDFLVAEYLPNGTFTDGIRYNANGSGDDVAWDVAEVESIVATGAVYTQHIIPPNQVYINREIYTTPYKPDNLPPTATFMWAPKTPRATDRVTFAGNASDPDGSIVEWQWSFGDGHTASQPHPSHVYAEKGVYTVSLTVTDDGGASHAATKEIVVAEEGKTPGFPTVACLAAGLLVCMLRRRLTFK